MKGLDCMEMVQYLPTNGVQSLLDTRGHMETRVGGFDNKAINLGQLKT
jgi:hypothetical protein